MKVLAMYLPQFHRIIENDEWWGEGFTEWTNLRKAKAQYIGHRQPRIPLNNYYYDLSEPSVICEQMNMAKQYGIDGFVIYHYWFKGKKLLEKPIEKMIENERLPIDFCLSWANEPWTRTWDGSVGAKEILMNQEYGDENDWKEHYDYLNVFFQHPNYLKKNNKPVFLIYNSGDIENQKDMYKLWDTCAKEKGFDGIEIIITKRTLNCRIYPLYGDSVCDFEPFATLNGMPDNLIESMSTYYYNEDRKYRVIDYKKFCDYMNGRDSLIENSYYGMFVGWDNSPRVGANVQLIFDNNTVDNFGNAFEGQYSKSLGQHKDFLFINAWNEWCESTYLEPDSETQYGYLEKIKEVRSKYSGL